MVEPANCMRIMDSDLPTDQHALANQIDDDNPSDSAWKEPLCLIESTPDDQLEVNPETLALLQKITDPVFVIGIVGPRGTGKSYLMNRLAGQTHGFAGGSAAQARTKGIWVLALQHPLRKNCSLLLLDTEGFDDEEKGNANYDTWIFALAVLLSSTMVYNSIGAIDKIAINKLHFVTKLAEHVKIQRGDSGDETSEFGRFFPSFIWVVRDFNLTLEIDGKEVKEDDYLEHALRLKAGDEPEVKEHNLPRECLRMYFPQRLHVP